MTKWTAEEQCTTRARLIYSTLLMGEEEQGGGGWHDNLQQAGDLVAMATKQGCIRGKSRRSAAEGTHAVRLTVMEDGRGQRSEWAETGGMPFVPYRLSVPSQPLLPQQDAATRQGWGCVERAVGGSCLIG